MSEEFTAWFDTRLAEAPPSLAAEIRSTLHATRYTLYGISEGAERLMHEARASASGRDGALTLLAADALTTMAHEWRSRDVPD